MWFAMSATNAASAAAGARTRAMIEVRDVEHETELIAQLREDEKSAVESSPETARTSGQGRKEGLSARVGAHGADEVRHLPGGSRWLGRDSNPRPCGYESHALTS